MTDRYTPELRREHTLKHIKHMADKDALGRINAAELAGTYRGMTACEVDAAIVRHLPEECAK